MNGASSQGEAGSAGLRQDAPNRLRGIWLQARSHHLWRRAVAAAPHLIAARGPRLQNRVGAAEVRRRYTEITDALQSGRLNGLSDHDTRALRDLIQALKPPASRADGSARSSGASTADEPGPQEWMRAQQEWYQQLRARNLQLNVPWFRQPTDEDLQQHVDRAIAEIGPPPSGHSGSDRSEGTGRR